MVIEENENANYLAHYKTKGAKNGIRRFQSYLVQPNPSGATGQEIGEAAAQRGRITGKKNDSEDKTIYKSAKELRKEARRQQKLQKIAAKRKKKETDDKEKWAKSYKELAKHKDAFTNEELRRAIDRLELESRITSSSLNSVRDKTQKGADILKNLDSAGRSMAGIYNTLAGGWNAYHTLTGKGKKLPTIGRGNESVSINKYAKNQNKGNSKADNNNKNQNNSSGHQNDSVNKNFESHKNYEHINDVAYDVNKWWKENAKQNKQNHPEGSPRYWKLTTNMPVPYDWNQSGNDEITNLIEKLKDKKIRKVRHDGLERLGPYLEHYGIPGQKWFKRHFQSYKTSPTRSGKVGEEIGLAAKQAERNGEEEDNESLKNSKQTSDGRWEKSLPNNSDINFDLDSAERAKTFSKNYEKHRKAIINQIAKDYALKYLNSQDPYWRTRPFKSSVDIGYEIGMAEVKARDGMKNSGMTFSVPSDKEYPIQVTMDPGDLDLYKGHVITFEYDDKRKRLSKSGYSVEG